MSDKICVQSPNELMHIKCPKNRIVSCKSTIIIQTGIINGENVIAIRNINNFRMEDANALFRLFRKCVVRCCCPSV